MEIKGTLKNWFKKNLFIWVILTFNALSLGLVIVLNALSIASFSWVSGWVLGFIAFWIVFFISAKSFDIVIKTDNHFLFYFLFLLKLGIYAAPLFIAFLNDNNKIHFAGVLIGLSSVVLIPFIGSKIINV